MAIETEPDPASADEEPRPADAPPAGFLPEDDVLVSPHADATPTISVVLPTLNEEAGITDCIRRAKNALSALDVTGEIIVSDSSDDRTPRLARALGARVIRPDRSGYGYAYRYAFEQARGEYVAIGDADCTYDFEELPKLYERVTQPDGFIFNGEDEPADLVLGSRFAGEIKPGAMPALHRYVGNPLLTAFLNVFYGAGVSDAHSGFRVIRREVLSELELSSNGMEFASEMVMEAAARGLTIAEVPITYHPRAGEATLDSFTDGWRHVKFMLLNAPGYLFSVPGVVMGLAGVVLMGLALFGVEVSAAARTVTPGVRTMVAGSLLTIAGYQVASLGLFATVGSDPIRRPTDPVTTAIVDRVSLEQGVTFGVLLFAFGGTYATYLIVRWLAGGYEALPFLTHDIAAFTAIVLGLQTVFGSFFMSAVGERG